ncbi:ATP-binding protein [Streptomyces sp. NPDC004647]|uniref:sensor histidine kinase n=1 Tax=Streptomyces sp. NPDC004647 TaxID=3154671 RepID=UPI0033A038E5
MRYPRRTPGGAAPRPAPPARGRRAHAGPPADEAESSAVPPGRRTATGRLRLRPRSVRAKIVCLLMVPVVSLLGLWAFATVGTAQEVARLRQLQRVDSQVREPVATAVDALQQERRAAVRHLAEPTADRADLAGHTRRTDRTIQRLRLGERHTVADAMELPAGAAHRMNSFVARAESLAALRPSIADRGVSWDKAYGAYTDAIDTALGAGGALAGVQDPGRASDARVLLELARSRELLSREDALLSAAQLTRSLDGDRYRQFAGAVEARRLLEDGSVADLRGADRRRWRGISEGSAHAGVRAVEDKVLRAAPGRKAADAAPADTWDRPYDTLRSDLRRLETGAFSAAAEGADPFTRGLSAPAGAAVLLGLAAVIASLVISVRIGRGLVVELITLRNSALELARHKLPQAMRRLRAGEGIDITAEAPPGPPAEDEVAQVGEALGSVHRAALRAAAERAELADGVSGIFVNLARRSQVLVHRQLALLDSMERRAEDPNELGDLFRLDHLTTRMRRHAESLIILSGEAPGRAWRLPVPLTDVVRAAVSEVEDYARVEVRQLPEAAVAGAAVADLTHLLAELLENAAQFSPPHTKVRVSGEPVGNGYALEVEDRGLGMGKDSLAEANRRIVQSEALDLFDSDRLGLFVVSRLAARHGVRVSLQPSPYGGTTVVVLLPKALLEAAEIPQPLKKPAAGQGVAGQGPNRIAAARANGRPTAVPGPRPGPRPVPGLSAPRHRSGSGGGEMPPGPRRVLATEQGRVLPTEQGGPDNGELPRRIRQASLVPQLREAPASEPPTVSAPTGDEPEERTPEQVRARMAAYRNGWARGGDAPAAGASKGDRS